MNGRQPPDVESLGPWGHATAYLFRFLFMGTALIACGWFFSNVHQIPPDSQALVMRFGAVARSHGPGLLIAWPRPIERVFLVPSAARQFELTIARFNSPDATNATTHGFFVSTDPRQNSGFLLTGDGGVVHLEARIFYQVTAPLAYMISSTHIEPALERLLIASAVSLVGSRDLDSVLVARPEVASEASVATRREHLRADLAAAINQRLEDLRRAGTNLGVAVSRVDLVPSIPAGAKEAFENVLVVTQVAEAQAATARTEAEFISQQANRNKDRIAASATASAQEVITAAKTQTAPILALEQQSHGMSRSMLLTRAYYDRVGPLLRKARRVSVVDRTGAMRTIVPGEGQ
jgi:regulator of protease activity HflC (stomatin/prohibitin superfamily)